jgi:hypothetical protein
MFGKEKCLKEERRLSFWASYFLLVPPITDVVGEARVVLLVICQQAGEYQQDQAKNTRRTQKKITEGSNCDITKIQVYRTANSGRSF